MNDTDNTTVRPIVMTQHTPARWLSGNTAVTLCGKTVTVTPQLETMCGQARRAGVYTEVSCPLCEAAKIVNALRVGWTQPPLEGFRL
ncbi:hypothetical protein [Bifidobacterium callitrichidarum]|uniref:Uncharacterized protein n=1 Tax=Bifidobacterium callitrichidarum TaxID=2052941 RepID=A0A2U2N437_9BIFI|nr:hypothetical protein [Bifidobacterium callitrichidarum]PWG63842.1 hypothetical protein DF196_10010 [Bifidobacterium callitrichidarum]